MKKDYLKAACLLVPAALLLVTSTAEAHVFLECGICSARKTEKTKKPDKLSFGVDARVRYSYMDNLTWSSYGDGGEDIWDDRIRAGIDYNPTDDIHVQLWGQYADTSDFPRSGWPAFRFEEDPDIYLANVEFKHLFGGPVNLKIGRQRLDYGDFRVIGLCDWANVGPYLWDAAVVSTRFENGFVDIFYGRNYTKDYDTRHGFSLNHDHSFDGAGFYSHYQLPKGQPYIAFEPFLITKWDSNNDYTGNDDLKDYYLGLRSYGRDLLGGLNYDLTYVREFGDWGTEDIDAFHFYGIVGYKFASLPWAPRISAAYTVSSGDDDPTDNTHGRYETAFGVWGAEYGGEYNLFWFKNFEDRQVNLEVFPTDELTVELRYHNYKLEEEKGNWRGFRDATGSLGDDIGDAVEFEARYLLTAHQDIGVLAGFFWPDDYAEAAASGFDDEASWIIVDWHVNFNWKIF